MIRRQLANTMVYCSIYDSLVIEPLVLFPQSDSYGSLSKLSVYYIPVLERADERRCCVIKKQVSDFSKNQACNLPINAQVTSQ